MIQNKIEYQAPLDGVVNAYNRRRREDKDHHYWEQDEVSPVRNAIKAHYQQEQGFKCCYCGITLHTRHGRVWDVEHIVPKSSHPQFLFEPENLAVSCIDCNTAKLHKPVMVNNNLVRYPRRSEAFVLIHPHYDTFEEHIAIHFERIYQAKTSKGAETIYICNLLRYSYEGLGWDAELCDDELLLDKYEEFMNTQDTVTRNRVKMEILMSMNLQVARSLQR